MGKDVDIAIRAKNAASKEIDKISASIKEFNQGAADLAKGAGQTGSALGGLATDLSKVQAEADRLKSLGRVVAELDKTNAAVARMEGNVRRTSVELARLGTESGNAAINASRLSDSLKTEEIRLASNRTALKAKRSELAEVNRLVKQAEAEQARYNKALGNTPDQFVRPAARSAGVFAAADLAGAKAQQTNITAEVKRYEQAVDGSTRAIKELRPQLSAASGLQRSLAGDTERVSAALTSERDNLGKATTELAEISAISQRAGSALGLVTVSQDQVSAAATRMAANLAAAKARIEGLASVKVTQAAATAGIGAVDTTALAAQRRAVLEANREWVQAEATVKRLAQELKATTAPTEELGAAFGRAQAQARNAKTAYEQQAVSLQRLSGASTSSFAAFARATAGMSAAGNATAAANAKIASSANVATDAQKKLIPPVREVGERMGAAAAFTNIFGGSLRNLQRDTRESLSLMQRLRGEVLSLTASYIGFQAALSNIGGAITAYQQLEAAQSRLGVVFEQDTGRVAQEIAFLKDTADRLGVTFGTLADEYGKFAVAAQAANFTSEETRRVFLSVAEAGRVNKLSADQMRGTFLALTQMMSKGKVTAEELRGQLGERLTGAFNIFADALGVSTAALSKMMEQGEVLADRETMLKFADELTRRFGPQLAAALDSASADIGRFENNVNRAQLTMANGLVPGLRAALQSFDEFSKSTDGQEFFTTLGVTVGKLLVILAKVPEYFDQISFAIQVFAALKLAEVLTGIIGRFVATSAAAAAFNREITLIGPRTQAAIQSQSALNRGFAQVVSTLGTYQQNLRASVAMTGQATLGTNVLIRTVGFLRAGLLATGTVARGFLAAFGGPLGIAITAVTFAVGQWITSVDTATSALTEHERQMNVVVTSYQNAANKADDWAKSVNGVTLSQAQDNLSKLVDTYGEKLGQLEDLAAGVRAAFDTQLSGPLSELNRQGMDPEVVKGIEDIVGALDGLKDRTLSIEEFRQRLDDIAQTTQNVDIRAVAVDLQNFLDTAEEGSVSLADLEKAISEAEFLIRVLSGTATEAEIATRKMGGAVNETADAFDRTGAIKTYTDAIDILKSKIPSLTAEMKKLKDMTELNKTAWDGMVAAFQAGDYSKIGQIIGLWAQAAGAVTNKANQQMMDAYPGAGKDVLERIIYIEGGQSGGGPSTSSARGIGQFTEGTWLGLFDRIFPELAQLNETQKLALRTNEEAARKMLDALTKDNQAALLNAGQVPTAGNTYLAHFLGSGDAIKVLLANPDELAANIVQKGSVEANPTVFKPGLTVGDLQQWANAKMGGGSPIQPDGMTAQENTDQDIQLRIDALKEEAAARAENNREAAIAKELSAAEAAATRAGTVLTEEQIAALREAAGAKYDSLHADEALQAQQEIAREALAEIVGLDQQRKTLLEEINMAQAAGDNSRTAELQAQLTGINGQLDTLIPKAMEFARALGDEKMVATLQKVQLNTAKAGQQFSLFGLSLNQTKGLIGNMADGIVGIFDTFAKAIANGENAVRELGVAFLQFAADFLRQIATMILKQMLLNALQAFFPGMGSFGAAHTGGMVGSAAVGGGNITRSLSPGLFANAMRYHTGGVVGLGPDEIPIIAKKNEEMLTEEDPRHRFNNTKEAGTQPMQPIKQVLVLDPRDLANAMASGAGEKVIVTAIKNNRSTLRALLG